jgi:hypothetical protein
MFNKLKLLNSKIDIITFVIKYYNILVSCPKKAISINLMIKIYKIIKNLNLV